MKTVDKKMIIRQVLQMDSGTAGIMMEYGLHCLGCPHASAESLEEAGSVHGIDVDAMVQQINEFLAKQQA